MQVPNALLVIAGEGPAREPLRQLVARMGLARCVRFVGYLDRNTALLDCYAAADVFVFASRTETQGLVLLEAMAQGTPVVSTAELGTKFVLQAGLRARSSCPKSMREFAAAVVKSAGDRRTCTASLPRVRQGIRAHLVLARRWPSVSPICIASIRSGDRHSATRTPASSTRDSAEAGTRVFCATLLGASRTIR